MDKDFSSPVISNTPSAYLTTNGKDQYSFYQPVWHFVLLSIITFGLYDVYWYYRNWKNLKTYKNLKFSVPWRTVGLFIPIYNLFLIYSAHREYRDLVNEEGLQRKIYPGLILVILIIASILTRLPDPFWLVSLIGTIPLAIVQGILNELWCKVQVDRIHRTRLRARQIALIVIGGLVWFLLLIGMSVGSISE